MRESMLNFVNTSSQSLSAPEVVWGTLSPFGASRKALNLTHKRCHIREHDRKLEGDQIDAQYLHR
jgi:hypothetical protein